MAERDAVGVADEDGRAADLIQVVAGGGDVLDVVVEGVLRGDHLVALRLERGHHLVEARAIGKNPVAEHQARLGSRRHSPSPTRVDSRPQAADHPHRHGARITPVSACALHLPARTHCSQRLTPITVAVSPPPNPGAPVCSGSATRVFRSYA